MSRRQQYSDSSSEAEYDSDASDIEDALEDKRRSSAKIAKPNATMYVAILTAMVGAIMFGIDCGNFGAVVIFDSFLDTFCVGHFGDNISCNSTNSVENSEWETQFVNYANVFVFLGAAVGAIGLGPPITNNCGRRLCISMGAGITFLGCMLTAWLSFGNVAVFLVGRIVTGFGIGLCCFALPMYNAEVSAPAVRGTTGSLFQLNVAIGGLLASIITAVCHEWEIGMMLPGFAGLIVMIAIWLTPESPRFVMLKKDFQAGMETLSKVRRGDVQAEAYEMKAEIDEAEASGQVRYGDYCRGSLGKRTFIAVWMQVAQQFTGMNAIIMYSGTLFTSMGFEGQSAFTMNMIFNVFMVFGMIAGLSILDSKFGGRRCQLLWVTAVCAPLLLINGLSVTFDWSSIFTLITIFLFAFTWQCAWGMIPWIYPSEIFSMAERERGMSFAVFMQYFANAVLVYVFPLLQLLLGAGGSMIFFGFFNVTNFIFVFMMVKETKGLPLEEVPMLFESKGRLRRWLGLDGGAKDAEY